MAKIYFDDALNTFAQIVHRTWGPKSLEENIFLRDADGLLTFVALDENKKEERKSLTKLLAKSLRPYIDDVPVATPEEIFDDASRMVAEARPMNVKFEDFSGFVKIIDRRLVGADWLRRPGKSERNPVRLVFASIKGGVGRSTALSVLAAHLAAHGKRILTIDMDLEAPGLGNMLLANEALPEFGLLDFLVEKRLGSLQDEFFSDLVGSSWLGGGKGRVDVIPALGKKSLKNPSNVLAKIARAYLPGEARNRESDSSFTEHVESLLLRVAKPENYDLVLIDARAGLHETAAAGVLGLGAEVLFFGMDQTQTYAGYDILFANIGMMIRGQDNDWRDRLSVVHSKASKDESARKRFAEKMMDIMLNHLWLERQGGVSTPDLVGMRGEFDTVWVEQPVHLEGFDGPSSPIVIPDSSFFQGFDPSRDKGCLEESAYLPTFGPFLTAIKEML